MKVITTPQELIPGRNYLIRHKQPFTNGTFPKPRIEKCTSHREDGLHNPLRQLGGMWCWDKKDKLFHFDAIDLLVKTSGKTFNEVYDFIRNNPDQNNYFGIDITEDMYTDNNQALKMWDVIGPIPEIKEEILHALFDKPELLQFFQKPVKLFDDGSVAVLTQDGLNFSDEEWIMLSDKEDFTYLPEKVIEQELVIHNPIQ